MEQFDDLESKSDEEEEEEEVAQEHVQADANKTSQDGTGHLALSPFKLFQGA